MNKLKCNTTLKTCILLCFSTIKNTAENVINLPGTFTYNSFFSWPIQLGQKVKLNLPWLLCYMYLPGKSRLIYKIRTFSYFLIIPIIMLLEQPFCIETPRNNQYTIYSPTLWHSLPQVYRQRRIRLNIIKL